MTSDVDAAARKARAQRIADARKAQRAARSERSLLRVGKWRIWRIDDENIVLEKDGEREDQRRYFPDVQWALTRLLVLSVEDHATAVAGDVLALRTAIADAERAILAALEAKGGKQGL